MAHNVRVRSPGGWTGTLPPADLEALDELQFGSLSKRGGAWEPNVPIELGGAEGLEVTGPSYFDDATGIALASGIDVEYDDYEAEREHLTTPGVGYGFEVGSVLSLLALAALRERDPFQGDMDAPALVQTEAEEEPSVTPRWWIPLALPVGAVVTSLTVSFSAVYAHAETDELPRSMPRVAIARAVHTEGGQRFAGSTFDTSASMSEYRDVHDVVLTDIDSPTVLATELWWAVIDGEFGEGASDGLYVLSVRTTSVQTAHDEFQT